MAQLLLIRGAKQLLTLRGPSGVRRGAALDNLGIIEDGSVLIRDGLIAQVGSTRRIENLKETRGAAEIAVDGAVVMPGFVDADIQLSLEHSNVPGKRKRIAEFYNESLLLMRSCLQHGTLTAQVKGGAPDCDVPSALVLLRQLAQIGNHPIAMVRSWRIEDRSGRGSTVSDELASAVPLLLKRKLAQRLEVAPETGRAARESAWAAASECGVGINLLWSGGSAESLANFLVRVYPQSVSSSLDLSSAEFAVLAASTVPIIFAPARSISENKSSDSLRQLADAGAPIALSSGYDIRGIPVFNMQTAIALAVLRLKLSTEQAISAATINAAYALGLGDTVGSLEAGKRADLLVMNLSDYREIPRRFGVNHVGMAIREGKVAFNRTGWKVSAA